jgi:hypothetical protein
LRAAALLLLFAGAARPQTPPPSAPPSASTGIAADRYAPAIGPGAWLGGDGAMTTPAWELSWAASLSHVGSPLRLLRPDGTPFSQPVSSQTTFDAGLELGLWKRLAVAVGVPIIVEARGDRLRGTGVSERVLGSVSIGDVRFRAKVRLTPDDARVGLALSLNVTIPGNGRDDFAATDGVSVEPRLHLELGFGRVSLLANVGVRFNPDRTLFLTHFGDEFTWLGGISVETFRRGVVGLRLLAEAAGAVGGDPGTRPIEVRGGLRLDIAGVWLDADGGAGVVKDAQSPSWRLLVALRGRFGLRRTKSSRPSPSPNGEMKGEP